MRGAFDFFARTPSKNQASSKNAAGSAAAPRFALCQRYISRPADGEHEDHFPITLDEFRRMRADEEFCLSWEAHGLGYGIPQHVLTQLEDGIHVIANGSRALVSIAMDVFPRLHVVHVTASPETLAARLASRGRETAEDIRARLARTPPLSVPQSVVSEVRNDGTAEQGVAEMVAIMQRVTNQALPPSQLSA